MEKKWLQYFEKMMRDQGIWQEGEEFQDLHMLILDSYIHRKNAGTLGMVPSCLTPKEPFKRGYLPNKHPPYKVNMGLIIKGPPSQGSQPAFFL